MCPGSLLLVTLSLISICMSFLHSPSVDFILEFVRRRGTSSVVILHCPIDGLTSTAEYLSARGVMSQHYDVSQLVDVTKVLQTETCHLCVVLKLRCIDGSQFLEKAMEAGLFSGCLQWLLVVPNTTMLQDFFSRQLPVDRNVVVVQEGEELPDVYQPGTDQPLVTTPGSLAVGGLLASRSDLKGIILKAGLVVTEDESVQNDDLRYKHLNTWGKIHYRLIRLLGQKLNFSIKEITADNYGYSKDAKNGSFGGLLGLLQRGEVDIGLGLVMKRYRMAVVDYTAETMKFSPSFIFRQPRLSSVSNIYTLPFSRGVWVTYLSTMVGLTGLLVAMQRFLNAHTPSADDKPLPSWCDVIFRAFGIICHEAYPDSLELLSSRIVLIFMFILAIFHLTSYSACVVSLLQTPSTGFDTLEELLDSPIQLRMHDIPYNYNYVNETNNTYVQRLFKEQLYSHPRREAFLSQEEGIQRVRKGMFAFHVDKGAFKIVTETFLEDEKCNLRTVDVFPREVMSIPVRKRSPYGEAIKIATRWLKETGLIDREGKRWAVSKPICVKHDSSFVSVGLKEFSPLLVMLFVGICISISLLLLENMFFHCIYRRFGGKSRKKLPCIK